VIGIICASDCGDPRLFFLAFSLDADAPRRNQACSRESKRWFRFFRPLSTQKPQRTVSIPVGGPSLCWQSVLLPLGPSNSVQGLSTLRRCSINSRSNASRANRAALTFLTSGNGLPNCLALF
jgi:hypothetical protein